MDRTGSAVEIGTRRRAIRRAVLPAVVAWVATAGHAARPPDDLPYASWRGSDASGSAPDGGEALVDFAAQARLLWVSEDDVPDASHSQPPRNRLTNPVPTGGYSQPVVAYGRVYLYYYAPSGLIFDPGQTQTAVSRGAVGREAFYVNADDVIHCFDAQTGKTVWRRVFKEQGQNMNPHYPQKCGGHFTPCVVNGRVYTWASAGAVYCVDAASGEPVWESDIGRRRLYVEAKRSHLLKSRFCGGAMGGWNNGWCVAYAGGVIATSDGADYKGGPREVGGGSLIGLDAQNGAWLWTVPGCHGTLNSAIPWRHSGQEYFLCGSGDVHGVCCVEPRTGRVLWSLPPGTARAGPSLAVSGDVLVCVGSRGGFAAYRLSPDKAELLWEKGTELAPGIETPSIWHGHVYAPTKGGLACIELLTGRVRGLAGCLGRGTSSPVAMDGRILMESQANGGGFQMIRADPDRFVSCGSVGGLTHANSVSPAAADGRLYFRTVRKLVCFELRRERAGADGAELAQRLTELRTGDATRARTAAVRLSMAGPTDRAAASRALLECALGDSPERAAAGIDGLGAMGDTNALAAVLDALARRPASRVGEAMAALAAQTAEVRRALRDGVLQMARSRPDLLQAACKFLAADPSETRESVRGLLIEKLRGPDPGGWPHAAAVLRDWDAEADNVVAAAMANHFRSGRTESVEAAIGTMQQVQPSALASPTRKAVVECLISVLERKSRAPRKAIIEMLGAFGEAARPAAPLIEAALLEPELNPTARESFRKITGRNAVMKVPSSADARTGSGDADADLAVE